MLSKSRKDSLKVTIGQALWAVSQALMIIIISKKLSIELVGYLILGLGIYAPLCLAGGLNLRTLIAIDVKHELNLRDAFRLRAAAATFSFAIVATIFWLLTDSSLDLVILLCLTGTRIADQICDIAAGHYQRINNHSKIGISFGFRGVFTLLPFIGLLLFDWHVVIASALSFFGVLIITIILDVMPNLRNLGQSKKLDSGIVDLFKKFGKSNWSAPFPFLDSLHANSLRYAIYIFLTSEILGSIGVAQTFYAPVQLLISSIGYIYLSKSHLILSRGSISEMRGHILTGFIYGVFPVIGFATISAVMPNFLIGAAFPNTYLDPKYALLLIALAMSPLGIVGFTSQILVVSKKNKSYSISPLIGLIVFWVPQLLIYFSGNDLNLVGVILIFFFSGLARLAFNSAILMKFIK